MTVLDRGPQAPGARPEGARPDLRAPDTEAPERQPTVLVFATDPARRDELVDIVEGAGWLPLVATSGSATRRAIEDALPDLLVLAFQGLDGDELAVLEEIRATADGERVPVVCVLDRRHRQLTIDAFGRRADDVVWGRLDPAELVARCRTRIERRPVPAAELVEDPVTGALTPHAFRTQLHKERERVARGGDAGALVLLSLDELPGITALAGSRARDELLAQVVRLVKHDGRRLDFVGSWRGVLALLLPNTPRRGTQVRCERLARKIYDHEFTLADRTIRLTPIIGYSESIGDVDIEELTDRAWGAMAHAADQRDLHPTRWVRAMSSTGTHPSPLRRRLERIRTPAQVVVQQTAALALPLAIYAGLDAAGVDITGAIYLLVVLALVVTAATIWAESRAALAPTVPPETRPGPLPPASAVIAAYLPNEAETIVETVEAFLGLDYPDLEIILAYNAPRRLPVEDELHAMAERDPRFRPLRVEGSVSKAQNVNAALAHVSGHFVGLFDADHHPAPGSFQRAWRWLDDGAGVVQGHCVIRNGATNFVTRLVAVEFESIYAVSHPGRARLHGFGIFGGSNGYWRTALLHRTRLRGSMLTEDIDSSMRVVQAGETIISDPGLVSTELAPETMGALWNQRLRWAQGWSQVSIRHLVRMIRSARTLRQRVGVVYLLGWREVYPWISLQVVPLLTYWWLRGDGHTDWFVPVFVATTLFTMSVGPAQAWFAYRLAHPSIRLRRRWFALFFVVSLACYTEFKNIVARTAQLKEAMRERKWKVTPRTGSVALDAGDGSRPATRPESPAAAGTIRSPAVDAESPERAVSAATSTPRRHVGARSARWRGAPVPRPRRHRTRAPAPAASPTLGIDAVERDPAPAPTVEIYDVERETERETGCVAADAVSTGPIRIYDVEREPADGRRAAEPAASPAPVALDLTTHDGHRPMILGVHGTPLGPVQRTARPGTARPGSGGGGSARVEPVEDLGDVLVGQPLQLEPLRPRHRPTEESDLTGA